MEIYDVIVMELNTRMERNVQVEVDEAENSENRHKLLEAEYGINCNGSRLNAVQSGMMETTDKIYLVEMGRQALMKDIVHIWDYADIDTFPNTKQQNEFFQQWIKL